MAETPGADRRRMLEAERSRALAEVRERRAHLDDVASGAITDGRDDEHDPDGSTPAFEHALAAGLLGQAERTLADIEAALERLTEGDYGRCVRCGAAIPVERLDAVPAATTCVRCASPRAPLGRLG